jgi:molecular chaperone GrpE (heat shock protein)
MNREANEHDQIEAGQTLIDQVVEHGYKYQEEIFRTAKVATVSK